MFRTTGAVPGNFLAMRVDEEQVIKRPNRIGAEFKLNVDFSISLEFYLQIYKDMDTSTK